MVKKLKNIITTAGLGFCLLTPNFVNAKQEYKVLKMPKTRIEYVILNSSREKPESNYLFKFLLGIAGAATQISIRERGGYFGEKLVEGYIDNKGEDILNKSNLFENVGTENKKKIVENLKRSIGKDEYPNLNGINLDEYNKIAENLGYDINSVDTNNYENFLDKVNIVEEANKKFRDKTQRIILASKFLFPYLFSEIILDTSLAPNSFVKGVVAAPIIYNLTQIVGDLTGVIEDNDFEKMDKVGLKKEITYPIALVMTTWHAYRLYNSFNTNPESKETKSKRNIHFWLKPDKEDIIAGFTYRF